jgi:hypothetical protein
MVGSNLSKTLSLSENNHLKPKHIGLYYYLIIIILIIIIIIIDDLGIIILIENNFFKINFWICKILGFVVCSQPDECNPQQIPPRFI